MLAFNLYFKKKYITYLLAESEERLLLAANSRELICRFQADLETGRRRQRRRSVIGSADLQAVDSGVAAAQRRRRFNNTRVLVHIKLTGVITGQVIKNLAVGSDVGVDGAGSEDELAQARSVGDVNRVGRGGEERRVVIGVADVHRYVDAGGARIGGVRVGGFDDELVERLLLAIQRHSRVDEPAAGIDPELPVAFFQRVTTQWNFEIIPLQIAKLQLNFLNFISFYNLLFDFQPFRPN